MIPYDKIFEVLLLIIGFVITKVQDREIATKKYRKLLDDLEKRTEAVTLLEAADDQFETLRKSESPVEPS